MSQAWMKHSRQFPHWGSPPPSAWAQSSLTAPSHPSLMLSSLSASWSFIWSWTFIELGLMTRVGPFQHSDSMISGHHFLVPFSAILHSRGIFTPTLETATNLSLHHCPQVQQILWPPPAHAFGASTSTSARNKVVEETLSSKSLWSNACDRKCNGKWLIAGPALPAINLEA